MQILKIVILLLLMTQTSVAAGLKDIPATRNVADKIMNYFLQEKFDEGVDFSKQYWSMASYNLDRLAAQLNSQLEPMKGDFGESVGVVEFVKADGLKGTFIRYFYLQKFENHAIYWVIAFYKPKKEWRLSGITFKSDTSVLFEKME